MVKFAACMQHAKDSLNGGTFGFRMDVHGNSPAVVRHGHAFVLLHPERNSSAVAIQRLVNGVVKRLPDEVM